MSDPLPPFSTRIVTLFGGSGFLGRAVISALAKHDFRVRIAVRRPNLTGNVRPFRVAAVQANLRFPRSVAQAVEGASIVINLVGVLQPSGNQTFEAVHAEGARTMAEAAERAGARFIHVSALGADLASPSEYARSKAAGEVAVRNARPDAVILRPSVMFGAGDTFFNRFGSLGRMLPVLPLAGADTRFQPVYVGDVATVIARAAAGAVPGGDAYELGGPAIKTLRELVEYVLVVAKRRRLIVPLPWGVARAQAAVLEVLNLLTLGLLPDELTLTRDQVALLQRDNVISEEAKAEGRTLQGLGITPTAFEAVVPAYLVRFRRTGQFEIRADDAALSERPDSIAKNSGSADSGLQPGRAGGVAVGQETSR